MERFSEAYYRAKIAEIYRVHNIEKLKDIDQLVAASKNNLDELLDLICLRYGVRNLHGRMATDELYENERYSYIAFSWGNSSKHRLLTDPRRFSDRSNSITSDQFEDIAVPLPLGWDWETNWYIDCELSNCDREGWMYAFDYKSLSSKLLQTETQSKSDLTTHVRRRRWLRKRKRAIEQTSVGDQETRCSIAGEELKDPLTPTDGSKDEPPKTRITTAVLKGNASPLRDILKTRDGAEVSPAAPSSSKLGKASSFLTDETLSEPIAGSSSPLSVHQEKTRVHSLKREFEALHLNLSQIAVEKKREQKHNESYFIPREIEALEKAVAQLKSQLKKEEKKLVNEDEEQDFKSWQTLEMLQMTNLSLDFYQKKMMFPADEYTLRLNTSGIFLGMKDFWLQKLEGSFYMRLVGYKNRATGEIEPRLLFKLSSVDEVMDDRNDPDKFLSTTSEQGAHLTFRGNNVRIVGGKKSVIPDTKWTAMFIDVEFEVSVAAALRKDRRTSHLTWKLISEKDSIRFIKFKRKLRGGLDLPKAILRLAISEIFQGLLKGFILRQLPPDIGNLVKTGGSYVLLCGRISADGLSIAEVVDKSFKSFSESLRSATSGQAKPESSASKSARGAPGGHSTSTADILKLLGLSRKQLLLLSLLEEYKFTGNYGGIDSISRLMDYHNRFIESFTQEELAPLFSLWQKAIRLRMQAELRAQSAVNEVEEFSFQDLMTKIDQVKRNKARFFLSLTSLKISCELTLLLESLRKSLLRTVTAAAGSKNARNKAFETSIRQGESENGDQAFTQNIKAINAAYGTIRKYLDMCKQNLEEVSFTLTSRLADGIVNLHMHNLEYEGHIDISKRLQTQALKSSQWFKMKMSTNRSGELALSFSMNDFRSEGNEEKIGLKSDGSHDRRADALIDGQSEEEIGQSTRINSVSNSQSDQPPEDIFTFSLSNVKSSVNIDLDRVLRRRLHGLVNSGNATEADENDDTALAKRCRNLLAGTERLGTVSAMDFGFETGAEGTGSSIDLQARVGEDVRFCFAARHANIQGDLFAFYRYGEELLKTEFLRRYPEKEILLHMMIQSIRKNLQSRSLYNSAVISCRISRKLATIESDPENSAALAGKVRAPTDGRSLDDDHMESMLNVAVAVPQGHPQPFLLSLEFSVKDLLMEVQALYERTIEMLAAGKVSADQPN